MEVIDNPDRPFVPDYASFGDRLLAAFVDGIVLLFLSGVVWLFSFGLIGYVGVSWAYYALLESSARQATFGKQIAGLIVTDLDGGRITLIQGIGRYLVRIVSYAVFFLGLFLMFFTERRQCLHDLVTATVVIKKG
jgi:uncharacterized RDD family membrane protein YckC